MYQEFARALEVPLPPSEVWRTLTDVLQVASWVPVVGSIVERAPLERYEAVLQDHLGPFRLRADLEITVESLVEGRSLRARGVGQDRQVGSGIDVEVTLTILPHEQGCLVEVQGHYQVTGRVATLGAAAIRKKGERILEAFFDRAAQALA